MLSASAATSSRERRWRRHLTDFRWPWAEYLPGSIASIIRDTCSFLYHIFNTLWTVKCVPFKESKSYIIKQGWEASHILYTQLPVRLYVFKQRCMLHDTSWIRFRAGQWYTCSIMQWIYRKESVRNTPSYPRTYSTCTVRPLSGRQRAKSCGCPPLVVRHYKTRRNKKSKHTYSRGWSARHPLAVLEDRQGKETSTTGPTVPKFQPSIVRRQSRETKSAVTHIIT